MSAAQMVFIFVIAWFTVIFAVLPWGNRPDEDGEDNPSLEDSPSQENNQPMTHGQSMGIPSNPRLWLKAGITTLLAGLITLAAWLIAESGLVSFRG